MTAISSQPDWYKDAIIYELHVRAFADSNDDGIGDFRGLTERLDYLQELGVTALWLLPFYPSPLRDGGYDIADYTSINPDYGTMRDFSRFVREAHRRGMRVITELVVNHTSDQHPWFQRARHAPPGSSHRDWYVWSDTDTKYAGTRIIFTDTETSNWTWDPAAGQYYWHRFFSHQPDMNYDHPDVRRAIMRVMKFWFDRGVDGLRLDAVPYLVERDGTNNENLPETHEVIKEWRAFVDERYGDRMLLAEANQWPEDVRAYFGDGDGDECHMAFHFPVMPRMFMALRQEDRRPIVDIMEQTPPIPERCQWALFLRNHDELTLEMVTDEERDYMYSIYATDARMRVNVGIRRRLAPLLDNNRRAIELLHGLLFSLPGTPIIYYGDEIGMGDNFFLGDRDGVRTPMQWNGDRNAGFSRADPARLYLPVIMDPLYGYSAVNVEAQERSGSSLLNWMRRMIALRGRRPALGRGDLFMLHPENRSVVAFLRRYGDEVMLVVANLSRFVQPVALDLVELAGRRPVEVIGQQSFPAIGEHEYFLTLAPHAFYWFDLEPVPEPTVSSFDASGPALRVTGDWHDLLAGESLEDLERELIPDYLARQRWYGGASRPERVRVHSVVPLRQRATPAWLLLADASDGDTTQTYVLVLAIVSGRGAREYLDATPDQAVAIVESARGRAVLVDGLASDSLCSELLDLLADERPIVRDGASLRSETYRGFRTLFESLEDPARVHRLNLEQSNTSVRFDEHLLVKLLRRFEPDPHPEIELGRHLAEHPSVTPRLVGSINLEHDGVRGPVAVANEFTWNRGNGWDFTVAACRHFLDEHVGQDAPTVSGRHPLILATQGEPSRDEAGDDYSGPDYAEHLRALGRHAAEMHYALADARGNPAFDPEPLTEADVQATIERVRRRIASAMPDLERIAASHDPRAAAHAALILEAARDGSAWDLPPGDWIDGAEQIRIHGDYHLGQVLVVDSGFVSIDFEGEVGLPVELRRQKASVFGDVAGMMRSLSYAGIVARGMQLQSTPDVEPMRHRLNEWTSWWEERAVSSFLGGYLEAAGDASFLPASSRARRLLLDLHLVDKALHEFRYEINHRPDWVGIPLEGLARLVAQREDT